MINFCTLFDSNYLNYGLALHESLQKNCRDFHLFIFAFDEVAEKKLQELALKNVTIISLKEFEDEKLLAVKPSRSKGEYCWTCTPSTVLYVLKKFKVASCTYIDADLYFFSDPKILIDELGKKSVSIIPHRYTKEYEQSEISGKYCVQFMTFKNDEKGFEVLNWWRERCIEWCFAKPENGKFGDQKYLDDWLTRFDCVYELQNLGGGVAPWNVQQYDLFLENEKVFAKEKASKKTFPIIFFHFHGFKFLERNKVRLTGNYEIAKPVKALIYKPYLDNFLRLQNIKLSKNILRKFFNFCKNIFCLVKKRNVIWL